MLAQTLVAALANPLQQPPANAVGLAVYPSSPKALSQEHQVASYGKSQPMCKDLDGLAVIVKHNAWVRNSAKAVTKNKGSMSEALVAQPPQQQTFEPISNMMGMMANAFQTAICQAVQVAQGQGQAEPKLQLHMTKGNVQQGAAATTAPLPLEDGASEQEPASAVPLGTVPDKPTDHDLQQDRKNAKKTLEEFEEENMDKLVAREKRNKKNASAGPVAKQKKENGMPKGMNRPAAVAPKPSSSSKKHCKRVEKCLGIFFRDSLGMFFRIPVCLQLAAFGGYNLAFCMVFARSWKQILPNYLRFSPCSPHLCGICSISTLAHLVLRRTSESKGTILDVETPTMFVINWFSNFHVHP